MQITKKVFLKILGSSQDNICARVSFLIKLQTETCNFIKKETQVLSCEFCKIFKNTYFTEHLLTDNVQTNISGVFLFCVLESHVIFIWSNWENSYSLTMPFMRISFSQNSF